MGRPMLLGPTLNPMQEDSMCRYGRTHGWIRRLLVFLFITAALESG